MFRRRTVRRLRYLVAFNLIAVLLNLTYPTPTHAAPKTQFPTTALSTITSPRISAVDLRLPQIPDKPQLPAKRQLVVRSSAYSSTPDQTDGDPFTTASGAKVHLGTVATNCLPFGTKIRIPDYFGTKIFTVEDRMHPKWGCGKIDVWMTSRTEAKQWGVRSVAIEIL